jgi:hypothetical protein
MKTENVFRAGVAFLLALVGCIREEPPSPYADIDSFALPENIQISPATFNRENITAFVRINSDLSAIVPSIQISEGATISPEAGTPQDFRQPVAYTVTAADGKHQRVYTVQLVSAPPYAYGFETWEALDKANIYETPVERDRQNKRTTPWDSSNKGIAIYQQYSDPSLYPIHKTTHSAAGQYAAEMLTQTGPGKIFGSIKIPIVAGSLFTGVLTPLNALINPLLATEFGQPFNEKPLRLTGKYIYRPGTGAYIDAKGNPQPNRRDSCAIYAVFFRSDETLERLNGTNVLTHPNIVAIAMMPPAGRSQSEGNDFTPFDIPFDYTSGHAVDFRRNAYKLTLVFSSSFMGDYYEGTPGSRLIIDDVEIITEETPL